MQIGKRILSFVIFIKYNAVIRVLLRFANRRLFRLLEAIRVQLFGDVPIAVGGAASADIAPGEEGDADLVDEPALGDEGLVDGRAAADDAAGLLDGGPDGVEQGDFFGFHGRVALGDFDEAENARSARTN